MTQSYITTICKQILNGRNTVQQRQSSILCIVSLCKKYPIQMIQYVTTCVNVIIHVLDPSDAILRKSILQSCTTALHIFVQNYPFVTFHQNNQYIAIAATNTIIVYDLRTATKYRILQGHNGHVNAVSFNVSGDILLSYSAIEQNNCAVIKIWNTAVNGLLSSLLGISGKCIQTIQLPLTDVVQNSVSNASSSDSSSSGHSSSSSKGLSRSVSTPVFNEFKQLQASSDNNAYIYEPHSNIQNDILHNNVDNNTQQQQYLHNMLHIQFIWLTPQLVQLRREDNTTYEFKV